MPDLIQDYREAGFAVVPDVLTGREVAQIREIAYSIANSPLDPGELQRRNGRPSLLFWPQNRSKTLYGLAHDRRLESIVRRFLGFGPLFQLNNQIYFRESGDGDSFAWHQDICFRTPPEEFSGIEDSYLQTIIVVDPIDDNGAIEFVPGSHRQGDIGLIPRDDSEVGLREFQRDGRQGVKVKAKPGDMLVWSVMVVHGSEPNTKANRMTYMNGFAKQEAVLNKGRFPVYAA